MTRLLAALFLALSCGCALAQNAQLQAFTPTGNTITFTANTTGNIPTPVQATGASGGSTMQYVITNTGAVTAFISYGTSAQATTNCVVPTSSSQASIPILAYSQFVMTTFANSFFCGITSSSTAVIYVTPGNGS